MASEGGLNLTGVWDGVYSYPYAGPSVRFVATLLDPGGVASGTAHEQVAHRGPALLLSTLAGHRDARSVAFRKCYAAGSGPEYGLVEYSGTLVADGTRIEGEWTIAGQLTGKFLMTRPRREELAAKRELAETV